MAMSSARVLVRLQKSSNPLVVWSTTTLQQGGRRTASGIALHTAGRSEGQQQFPLRTALPRLRGSGSGANALLVPRQFARGLTAGVDFNMLNMPALSPTMESGTIAQWHKAPGDELAAGDVICDVETDKATVAFDVQDDGMLAKIIAEAGSGEVDVGSPVAVIVEDAGAYEAFVKADAAGEVVLDLAAAAPAAAEAADTSAPAAEEPKAAPAPTPAPVPVPAAVSPKTEAVDPPVPKEEPVATPAAPAEATPMPAAAAEKSGSGVAAHVFRREWGSGVSGSPLAHRMSAEQKKYVERFGSTLQLPLEP